MMARIGGRSLWLAIPVGVLSVAVVGALVWLAVPMVPVAVTWVGDTLRSSAEAGDDAADTPDPAALLADGTAVDCRDLYPDDVWSAMIWHGDVLLSQTTNPPPIAAPEIVDAMAPTIRLTCSWAVDSDSLVVSTFADVGADTGPVLEGALTAQGFSCSNGEAGLTCARTQGRTVETHALRDGLWLSSVTTGWAPEDYGSRLAAYVWG